ncbi:MAG: D-hexose-6-phosphate mutarotase [Candidatus Acidiferrum sp.]|jgi:glucose-6-phosphate 1-epimerase
MTPTNATTAELDSRFAIAGLAQIVPDEAGHPKVRISSPKCTGVMHLHGAQVNSWKPADTEEVIFLSSRASFAEGKAIRGGIPICFPWFRGKSDDAHAPAHGVVRTKLWTLESIAQQDGDVVVSMSTESGDDTKKWWPGDFRAVLRVTFGATLKLEFTVSNTGTAPMRFEAALHTYYHVGDIRKARLQGLDGATYLDNTDGNREKIQAGRVAIGAATDSAYINNENALELIDPVLKRRIHIAKKNSHTTVVWNPWDAAAAKMADLGEGEWQKMFCAEAANILVNAVTLAPGAQHTIGATTTVSAL